MKLCVFDTAEEASRQAALLIDAAVRNQPATVLGLATGGTPLALYREMIRACRAGTDYSRVTTFNLDEYCGLPASHPQSYRTFMDANLFSGLNIAPQNTHIPDGLATPAAHYCHAYEAEIRAAGGIDIQILGIGSNGHIGFNEPGSAFDSRTRVVSLTPQTVRDNARFFHSPDAVPRSAISMGIGTILEARQCILLGFGEKKAQAVRAALEGPATTDLPASALQSHPDVLVFLDKAAASALSRRE